MPRGITVTISPDRFVLGLHMLIAQADSSFGALYAVYILVSVVYAIQVSLVYFVIWTRKDWLSETRIASTIAVALVLPSRSVSGFHP